MGLVENDPEARRMIEAALAEVEKLRIENAALKKKVEVLQESNARLVWQLKSQD